MVVIRLARAGSKKRPFYHVVVIDSRRARDSGNSIERLGYFNPVARGAEVRLHLDDARVAHWISKGAQPSDRVSNLMSEAKSIAAGLPTAPQKRKTKLTARKAKAALIKKAEKMAETPEVAQTSEASETSETTE